MSIFYGIIIHLINRSPWTIKIHFIGKLFAYIIVTILTIAVSWSSLHDQWVKDHPTRQTEQKPSASLSERPKQEPAKKLPKQTLKPIPKKETPPERQPEPQPQKDSLTEVILKFVYPKSPALVIENLSASTARDIKWIVLLWNMDLPDRTDPLPIPVQTFDWIKGHDEGGPQMLFSSQLVSPLLKPGNRLLGSASIDCPTCKGRTYVVYIIWGQGGWFSEFEYEKSGDPIVPKNFSRTGREAYFKQLIAEIPENKRSPIKEK